MRAMLPPVGFVVAERNPYPFFGLRIWRFFMAAKPTRNELFSEREGHTTTLRLAGVSVTFRRVIDPK